MCIFSSSCYDSLEDGLFELCEAANSSYRRSGKNYTDIVRRLYNEVCVL